MDTVATSHIGNGHGHTLVCMCVLMYLPSSCRNPSQAASTLKAVQSAIRNLASVTQSPTYLSLSLPLSLSLSLRALFHIFKVCLCRFLLSSTNTSRPTETSRPKLSCLQTHSVPSHLIPFHALSGKCFSH